MSLFYKPPGARLGDTIPYFHGGVFHVFYLRRSADDTHDTVETPWAHISTVNLIDYTDHGIAIAPGGVRDHDHSAATGSIIERGGRFYAFYTGFSTWQRENGGRDQSVLRAVSDDLITWTKDDAFRLIADERHYDAHQWRDPLVLPDPSGAGYRMLITARRPGDHGLHGGLAAQAWSEDLDEWRVDGPFWDPGLHSVPECMDLFQLGDWWYLTYSTLSERTVTRYRYASSPNGPWICPPDDELDGPGFYAGKTAGDGEHRYLFGWCVNSQSGHDGAPWLWGGNLIVHELTSQPDGTLAVSRPTALSHLSSASTRKDHDVTIDATNSFSFDVLGDLGQETLIDSEFAIEPGTRRVGLLLNTSQPLDVGYRLELDLVRKLMVFDRLDRPEGHPPLVQRSALDLGASTHRLTVATDGEIFTVYLDNAVAFTCRGYDRRGSLTGFFVADGAAHITGSSTSLAAKDTS